MSVLIEDTSLVATRDDLEQSFPGGVTAFLESALELSPPPRFVCDGDPHLVSLSFHGSGHAQETIALLRTFKVRWVLIDAEAGPLAPMSWIEWKPDAGGVARAWLAGTRAGKLAIPSGWSPEVSDLFDVEGAGEDEAARLLRLAVEDGVETFLDLETGAQIQSEPDTPAPPASRATPLHDALIAAINALDWRHYFSDAPVAYVDHTGKAGVYSSRYLVNEAGDLVLCFTRAPLFVPLRARRKVMEFITRVNRDLTYGCFDMSLDDGRLGVRTSVDVEGAFLSQEAVQNLASNNVHLLDRYYPALMEVVYGKRSPKEALEQV